MWRIWETDEKNVLILPQECGHQKKACANFKDECANFKDECASFKDKCVSH